MICNACETSNKDDAQYCKGCGRIITAAGTTVDAPPDEPAPPAAAPPPAPAAPAAAPPPPSPAAIVQPTQPLPVAEPAYVAETTVMAAQPQSDPPAQEPDQTPPAWIFILGGVAIGALLLVLATILIGNSDDPTSAPTSSSSAETTSVETVVQTTLPPTTSTAAPATTALPPPSIDEFFGSAVAILASIPKDGSTFEEAETRAAAIAATTGANVRVIDSSIFASLRDGFWVVAEGKYASPEEAAWRCWELGLQTSNECYGRQISDDPADLDGTVVPIPQP